MRGVDDNFDMALSYPQWQGSGRSENLIRGAQAAALACGQYGPLASVPLAGAGEEGGGINRWTAILEQFRSTARPLDCKTNSYHISMRWKNLPTIDLTRLTR